MSSQINETNIDSTYPVAGKDNDSQGFRDNFAAIKEGLSVAKGELSDLQSKVLLKSALTGQTLNNDLGGSNISNGNYTNFHGTSYAQTVTGSANIDVEKGNLQVFTLSSNSTFTFTNWPSTGQYGQVRVHFKSNGSVINVGNDITTGKRYTINEVNNTNFVAMGADPTAVFVGSINGSLLNVTSKSAGTITVGTYITGTGVTPGTHVIATNAQNGTLTGTGGTGTYTVSTSQATPSTAMDGMTVGVVFTAVTKGSGSGTVKPWKEVILATEGTGSIVSSSDFDLPILLNPNGADQVIDAWTYTGSTTGKVYVGYVSNLDSSNTNYTNLNVGTLSVDEQIDSSSTATGALQVKGGAGIVKNLNVGGSVVVDGDLLVNGNTVLTTSSITINDIGDIGNVDIVAPRNGDALKYNSNTDTWSNNVDLVESYVTIPNGVSDVFTFDGVPITEAGLKFAVGKKYRFNLSDSTNFGLPLRFSTTPDNDVPGGSITPYTTEVTISGTAGVPGENQGGTTGVADSYVELLVTENTPSPLYMYVPDMVPNPSGIGASWPIRVGSSPVRIIDDYSPTDSQAILADTSLKAITITLPLQPSAGTTINIVDSGNATNNPITIDPNDPGVLINGIAGNVTIEGSFGAVNMVCDGTNWTLVRLTYNGSEDVAPSGTISTQTSVSYFSTSGLESSTLGSGVEGQVKTLVMKNASGKMEVSVTNAGWTGGAGTITFNATGDACTLQFVQGNWYIIGNNNCQVDNSIPGEIVTAPSSSNASGTAGQMAYDNGYVYVCIADNTWRRAALATWP